MLKIKIYPSFPILLHYPIPLVETTMSNNLLKQKHILFMPKTTEEESFFKKYKKTIENLYEHSRLYRDLVYLSKVVRMSIYIIIGVSIIIALFRNSYTSFDDLIYLMTRTIIGKILALLIAFSFIIYGLEKPRK
jgi:hypothetical protein